MLRSIGVILGIAAGLTGLATVSVVMLEHPTYEAKVERAGRSIDAERPYKFCKAVDAITNVDRSCRFDNQTSIATINGDYDRRQAKDLCAMIASPTADVPDLPSGWKVEVRNPAKPATIFALCIL